MPWAAASAICSEARSVMPAMWGINSALGAAQRGWVARGGA